MLVLHLLGVLDGLYATEVRHGLETSYVTFEEITTFRHLKEILLDLGVRHVELLVENQICQVREHSFLVLLQLRYLLWTLLCSSLLIVQTHPRGLSSEHGRQSMLLTRLLQCVPSELHRHILFDSQLRHFACADLLLKFKYTAVLLFERRHDEGHTLFTTFTNTGEG